LKRRFHFLRPENIKAWICIELMAKVPALEFDRPFLRSVPLFIDSNSYTAYRTDEILTDGSRVRYAGGLAGAYLLPFTGEIVLCVEAAWFLDDDPEAHSFIWRSLLGEALDMEFSSLCVIPATTTHTPQPPPKGGPWSDYGVVRNKNCLLKAPLPGAWSAYFGIASPKAAFADCLRILPQVAIDLTGREYTGPKPLFRGEGRVNAGPYLGCSSLYEVAKYIFDKGFSARAEGNFAGIVPHQIMHQGYVPSPTVSLTASFEVAAQYATRRGQRDAALVFEIDPERVRKSGPIWDTFATLQSCGSSWVESDWGTTIKFLNAIADLQISGKLLQGISEGIQEYASARHESLTNRPYSEFVPRAVWDQAKSVLEEEEIEQLCTICELYLTFHNTPEGLVASSRYAASFLTVHQKLIEALEGASEEYRNPGWDATVFGYFAKTCRDMEFLSTGPIAGSCVSRAWIINREGQPIETLEVSAVITQL